MNADIQRYFALTLDPLHIGAGGYRLGRVDNTIVREPGTDLPKIPGSSISGVCRNNAIYALPEQEGKDAASCATGGDKDQNNCGECVICKTFGYANGTSKKNQIGRVKFFDGRLLAFPVRSMAGPVWVTTAILLEEAGGKIDKKPGNENLIVNFELPGGKEGKGRLNLGWLYLDAEKDAGLSLPPLGAGTLGEIGQRLVVAPEWLFPEIVNNNLEVRTSVSIDFETGAAKSGALFTYEAIPRAALFTFDVAIDAFRCQENFSADKVKEVVNGGLDLFETLGMGGMNTRGFGRLKIEPVGK